MYCKLNIYIRANVCKLWRNSSHNSYLPCMCVQCLSLCSLKVCLVDVFSESMYGRWLSLCSLKVCMVADCPCVRWKSVWSLYVCLYICPLINAFPLIVCVYACLIDAHMSVRCTYVCSLFVCIFTVSLSVRWLSAFSIYRELLYTYINRVSTAAPGWFPAVESAEFYADHLIMSPVHRRSCHLSYGPSTCGISCLQLWTCHCRYFGRYTSLCNKKLCYLFRPTWKQTSIFVNSWSVSVLNCGLKMLNAYNYT